MAHQKVVTATGRVELGDACDGAIGSYVVQVHGTFSGLTADIQTRVRPAPGDTTPPWVDTAYTNQATGAAVTAGTDVTAAGIYKVQADGSDVAINVTALSSGSVVLTCAPLVG